jgi:hypothetical protein
MVMEPFSLIWVSKSPSELDLLLPQDANTPMLIAVVSKSDTILLFICLFSF